MKDVVTSGNTTSADDEQPSPIARYGQLCDDDLSGAERAEGIADLLTEITADSGAKARRATPVQAGYPSVALQLDGVPYLLALTWPDTPATPDEVGQLRHAAASRPGVRMALLCMGGYAAAATQSVPPGDEPTIVLLDSPHLEALLTGVADTATVIGLASDRALFDGIAYTSLTDLLIDEEPKRPPAGFLTPDRLPPPWNLAMDTAPHVRVQHILTGDAGWREPLGLTVVGAARLLITTDEGLVEVDRKRGSAHFRLPLSGCRGAALPRPDGGLLTLRGSAVIEWKDGVLTPIAGDLADARGLLAGPGGDAWVLSGHGPDFGSGTATLALTHLGGRVGRQQRRRIWFNADVHTAGWLSDLRFFLAAAGHSAVVDLARSSRVREAEWIKTPHHSPDHLVVDDPDTVITVSPDGRGVAATIYRTNVASMTSELLTGLVINRVHGLAPAGRDGGLTVLGDVRGNDVTTPHPVVVEISRPARAATAVPSAAPAIEDQGSQTLTAHPVAPQLGDTTVLRSATDAEATSHGGADLCGGDHAATNVVSAAEPAPTSRTGSLDPVSAVANDPLDQVRLAAQGLKSDYRLDSRRIGHGGQAEVFRAVHKLTQVSVAFKRLTSRGPDQIARMRREVEAAQQFGASPHVMSVLDFSPTYEWLVMPLADDSAQTHLADLADPVQLRALVTAVCEALREPHRAGWIHRDLTPDNVLWCNGRWVVADWGLGRRPRGQTTDPRRTHVGERFGTEGFAPPEQGIDAHAVGPQADIYSIGQIIGWALTGRWPQANVALLPPAGPWRTIVRATTDPDPDRRPRHVDELLALLARELDEPPELPVNRGKTLLAAASSGDRAAVAALWHLAGSSHADYELYMEVLLHLDEDQTRAAVAADPRIARDVVRAVEDLRTGGYVTLEYGDVDRLVLWLLTIARHAEQIEEWELVEDAAGSIMYLDGGWDRWRVQSDIRAWLATRSGHAASIAAAALRRYPDARQHFAELAHDATVEHRIRGAVLPATLSNGDIP